MVVVFVSYVFQVFCSSKKPSEREFFVPAGTDLAVKLLMVSFQPSFSAGWGQLMMILKKKWWAAKTVAGSYMRVTMVICWFGL